MTAEYRVVWRREGQTRLSTRRYQRRSAAVRLLALLAGDPHSACSHGEDDYCYWETGGHDGTVPPFTVEPRIEVRQVGPWTGGTTCADGCDFRVRCSRCGAP